MYCNKNWKERINIYDFLLNLICWILQLYSTLKPDFHIINYWKWCQQSLVIIWKNFSEVEQPWATVSDRYWSRISISAIVSNPEWSSAIIWKHFSAIERSVVIATYCIYTPYLVEQHEFRPVKNVYWFQTYFNDDKNGRGMKKYWKLW